METKTIDKTADCALQLPHLTHEVSKARTLVNDVVEDGKRKCQRLDEPELISHTPYTL